MWNTSLMMPVPSSGHLFDTTLPVLSSDLDEDLHIRPDGIARYLQEAGMQHLVWTGMQDSHPHWIVRRTVIDVIKPIEWPAELRVRRWCAAISPRWCSVRIRIDGPDGGLIETEAFWIHMNIDTMAPSRLSDEFVATFGDTALEDRLRWKAWLTDDVPSDCVTEFPLRRTDIDHFKHLTNAAYWQGVHEVTGDQTDLTSTPHRYVIEYNKPIAAGEKVEVHTSRSDGLLDIAFVVAGDTRTRAALARLPH